MYQGTNSVLSLAFVSNNYKLISVTIAKTWPHQRFHHFLAAYRSLLAAVRSSINCCQCPRTNTVSAAYMKSISLGFKKLTLETLSCSAPLHRRCLFLLLSALLCCTPPCAPAVPVTFAPKQQPANQRVGTFNL